MTAIRPPGAACKEAACHSRISTLASTVRAGCPDRLPGWLLTPVNMLLSESNRARRKAHPQGSDVTSQPVTEGVRARGGFSHGFAHVRRARDDARSPSPVKISRSPSRSDFTHPGTRETASEAELSGMVRRRVRTIGTHLPARTWLVAKREVSIVVSTKIRCFYWKQKSYPGISLVER